MKYTRILTKRWRCLRDLNHDGDKELRLTLDDIRTIAWLGKYYAHKIQAATELALFRETLKPEHRDAAIRDLQQICLLLAELCLVGIEQS